MALTFPLAAAEFFDTLKVSQMTFDCPEQVQVARTGGGEILPANIGPRLWTGEVVLWQQRHSVVAPVLAMISALREPGASFLAYDLTAPAPQSDPEGTALATVTPLILALPSDARMLSLEGLPSGFVLTAGDYLGFSYGTNPVRRALHRVVSGVVAGGTGQTAAFEVTPPRRPGAAINTAVSLVKASCKARIVPGSVAPGTKGQIFTSGITFKFMQTLR